MGNVLMEPLSDLGCSTVATERVVPRLLGISGGTTSQAPYVVEAAGAT